MVVAYSIKFGITNEGRSNFIDLLKIYAGPSFQYMKISDGLMDKMIDIPPEAMNLHFYCMQCFKLLKSTENLRTPTSRMLCKNCHTWNDISLSKPNFFMQIDLKYQIELLFKRDIIKKSLLMSLEKRKNRTDDSVRDVNDGKMLEGIVSKENETVLTLNINTDGVQIFSCSKRSLWPLQVMINDLDYRLRCSNILLAGVMIVSHEPSHCLMDLFMKTFVNQLNSLNDGNFTLKLTNSEKEIDVKFSLACVCVDSVARPIVQNRV